MSTYVLTFSGLGLLLIALALPLYLRKLPPNRWYGVRVSATFADEAVWYEANALSGRDLIVLGVLQVLVATLLPALLSEPVYVFLNLGIMLAGGIAFGVAAVKRANRLLAERRRM
jgi:uncharacterized membrane protein